jgi:nucleoside phosphorylase
MADLRLAIFSFTETEERAVRRLLEEASPPGGAWTRAFGRQEISAMAPDGRTVEVAHRPIRAQGNVVAAAELAASVTDDDADLFLFYGCAGALDEEQIGDVHLVGSVSYASLGSVEAVPSKKRGRPARERVTLKNKWIVRTQPPKADPLQTIAFPSVLDDRQWDLPRTTGLDVAHVMATDKVIKVAPASIPPRPHHSGPTGPVHPPRDWTYAKALAQVHATVSWPVLIDMESYGIGRLTHALGVAGRVVVVRVVTDALTSKDAQTDAEQAQLLIDGRLGLARVIGRVLEEWT